MMWPEVIQAWVALMNADAALIAALGGQHIYPAQAARAVRVPSVEYSLVSDIEEESFNPIIVQVDYWAKGTAASATIERRIRRLTHRDTARTLGSLRLWTRYLDSRSHQYPAELGVVHRSLDFEFTPVRGQYAAA